MMHAEHKDIDSGIDASLSDDCQRCWYIAEHIFSDADDELMTKLVAKVMSGTHGRTSADIRAMHFIKRTMDDYNRIDAAIGRLQDADLTVPENYRERAAKYL